MYFLLHHIMLHMCHLTINDVNKMVKVFMTWLLSYKITVILLVSAGNLERDFGIIWNQDSIKPSI